MVDLSGINGFEWDEGNLYKSIKKHIVWIYRIKRSLKNSCLKV